MFTSFYEEDFWKAIEEKNYTRLKINTVSSILNDPTFARGETDKILNILKDKVPGIFEEEHMLDDEERLDRSAWDKEYFYYLTCWLEENFAESRIGYIKEVGCAVHQDTERTYNESMNLGTKQTQHKPSERQQGGLGPNPPEAPRRNLSVAGVVAAVAALVLVILLLTK